MVSGRCRQLLKGLVGLCVFAQWGLAGVGLAAEHDWELRVFAQTPRAQRNRLPAEQIPVAVAERLSSILGQGVRGCDCLPRTLSWVWSLPRPSDRQHPSLVVFFEDKPRRQGDIRTYERLAFLAYKDGWYVVTGVLTLNRPSSGTDASLDVRTLPRRDFDRDGQLDIGVSYRERFDANTECGTVKFQSGSAQPAFETIPCEVSPRD